MLAVPGVLLTHAKPAAAQVIQCQPGSTACIVPAFCATQYRGEYAISERGWITLPMYSQNLFVFRESAPFAYRRASGYIRDCANDIGWHTNQYGGNSRVTQITDWYQYVCGTYNNAYSTTRESCENMRTHEFQSISETHYIDNYQYIAKRTFFPFPYYYYWGFFTTWNDSGGSGGVYYSIWPGANPAVDFFQ